MLRIKRAYDEPAPDDGVRMLVDRLWPRGLKKEDARIDQWRGDLAPSSDLRKWYGHDQARWEEFRRRYRAEIESSDIIDKLRQIKASAKDENITLVFGAKDVEHSHAKVLQEVVDSI